jgi:hypothetical protein
MPKAERDKTIEALVADIMMQLDCLKAVSTLPERAGLAGQTIELLRRVRALLLLGDLGTDGKVSALVDLLERAAEDVSAGANPSSRTREAVELLGEHGFRVRGAKGPHLHEALLSDRRAMEALERAVRSWASGEPEMNARLEVFEATWRIGLQTQRDKQHGQSKAKRVSRDRAAQEPHSGLEDRAAGTVRMALARSRRAAAEPPRSRRRS